MELTRFDNVRRSLTSLPSRRNVLRGLAGAGLGLAAARLPQGAQGKQKRKKRPRLNQYGCIDVGEKCYGNEGRCCSGICEGTGKRSRCVAHHTGSCTADQNSCPEPVSCGAMGRCYRTTGKARFCGDSLLCDCAPCQKDSDCEAQLGPGAACIVCTSDCVGVNGSRRGTACIPAATIAG